MFVLESDGATLRLQSIPSISLPGYMGHDEITVRDNVLWSSFPTYIDAKGPRLDMQWKPEDVLSGKLPRLDMQWKPEDALSGKLPIASGSDTNAAPSGSTRKLRFDYATGRWE